MIFLFTQQFLQMEKDGFLVCDRHKKQQKNLKLLTCNYNVCLNRYCPKSYTLLCASCRPEHRDHTTKIMSLEDLHFLLDCLLQKPFTKVGVYMAESIQIMKKLHYIRDFKKKIDLLESSIETQTFSLLTATQSLISEFALSKKLSQEVSDSLAQIGNPTMFQQLKEKTILNLSRLEYNFKTDKLQYYNPEIKEKLAVRKTISQSIQEKFEELREYNMKIIEVVLNSDYLDEEEEEDLFAKKKEYESLKEQLQKVIEEECEEQKSKLESVTSRTHTDLTQSNSISVQTINESKEDIGTSTATQTNWKHLEEQYELKIKKLKTEFEIATLTIRKLQKQNNERSLKFQKTIESLKREKISIVEEKENLIKKVDKKNEILKHFAHRLEDNKKKRNHRELQRTEIIKDVVKIIEEERRNSISKEKAQFSKKANYQIERNSTGIV